MLLTNDGALAHRLLSPKKHVPKRYLVKTDDRVLEEGLRQLTQGVRIGEDEITLPATVLQAEDENTYFITITEGKFHQVKRMLAARGAPVLYLERVQMGNLPLDRALPRGSFRFLTEEEIAELLSLV